MENASKALIIAGAILLSILIIAIGMYIFNSSSTSINDAATRISQQEIQSFNKQFEMYEGRQVGTNVKSLIQNMSAGASQNGEESTKLPDLWYQATAEDGEVVDVMSNVTDTNIAGFNAARTAIQARHYYNVVLLTSPDTGLIDGIVIEYEEGSVSDDIFNDNTYTPDDRD